MSPLPPAPEVSDDAGAPPPPSPPPSFGAKAARYGIPIVGLLLVIVGLAAVKGKQFASLMAMGTAMAKAGPPPENVSVTSATEQQWDAVLAAVGSVTAAKGVAISNDAPGVVTRILFESGAQVRAGDVLLELDSSVERAQLASAQARQGLAQLNADRTRALVETGGTPRSQLDTDDAQRKAANTDVAALSAQLGRKVVRAPFAGRLGLRAVNLGQYLNPGTMVTTLEAIETVYVDFSLPQERLASVKVGMPVRIAMSEGELAFASDAGVPLEGSVAAIDPTIDATTRMVKLRATVPNAGERLRPGMFVRAFVVLPEHRAVVTVPQTAVLHASYGDSVFVVEDALPDAGHPGKVARQQFVRTGEARGDFIAVKVGVQTGQEVVTAGSFKLRNGSRVKLVHDVKPAPELHPAPENH